MPNPSRSSGSIFPCPSCQRPTLCRVVDSASAPPDHVRRRQRECDVCGLRFVTREVIEHGGTWSGYVVAKKRRAMAELK